MDDSTRTNASQQLTENERVKAGIVESFREALSMGRQIETWAIEANLERRVFSLSYLRRVSELIEDYSDVVGHAVEFAALSGPESGWRARWHRIMLGQARTRNSRLRWHLRRIEESRAKSADGIRVLGGDSESPEWESFCLDEIEELVDLTRRIGRKH